MYDFFGGGPKILPKKPKKHLPCEFALIGVGIIAFFACKIVWHGSWTGAEAYSHPTIVMSYKDRNNKRVIVDDYREAYSWLRRNTKPDAKVMSWWDYGYQIAGMANRTTIVDNNTWNKTHIAKVGMTFASREEEAHEIATNMDVDYMLVIFGGISGYSGDDINKFLWMIRIGGSENPHIKESDYHGAGGRYRVDQGGSRTLLNSLMYKLCYYRFGEIDQGKGHGYDVQRRQTIGNPNINLNYFEEAFSTKNWIVRIFRVKKKGNRDGIRFEEDKKTTSIQALSGLSEGLSAKSLNTKHRYRYKLKN
jgi:dolichyl-diphosphooligosaccharide--protein glycosyltransferase